MRVHITLECTECHERNYLSTKSRRNNPDRLELKKYCPRERKVTLHRETNKDSGLKAQIRFFIFWEVNRWINQQLEVKF